MLGIIIIITILSISDEVAFSGQRLRLNNHPAMIRVRWLLVGIAIGFQISGYDLLSNSVLCWAFIVVFLITMAKKADKKATANLSKCSV